MLASPLFSAIPANKFYPPRLVSGRILQRPRLTKICQSGEGLYQYVFIEAQAGQGKTTTAIQFLEARHAPFMWFQVGEEDHDPIIFLVSILLGIQKTFPEYTSIVAESQLAHGQVPVSELAHVLNRMLQDLDQWLSNDLIFVFDDVHLLEGASHSLGLLDHLLDTLPPRISVMLLSRRAIAVKSKRARFGGSTLVLANSDLALTRDEGVELLALLLDDDVEQTVQAELVEHSGGWPMGLVLTVQNYLGGSGSHLLSVSSESYFEDELLASLSGHEQHMILKLALLNEIPLDLAEVICPDMGVADFLLELTRQNFFLRLLDDNGTLFGFHHHFLAFLRKRGILDLDTDERNLVCNVAAETYIKKGMIGRGMSFFVKAASFSALEAVFEEYGHGMVARNRHVTLKGILKAVPKEKLAASGWLSYFMGLILQVPEPKLALSFLQQSRLLFAGQGNEKGELLAACGILYLYIIHSHRLPRTEAVFPQEVDLLFRRAGERLSEFARIFSANHLALGFLFFFNDFAKAHYYNKGATELATKEGLTSLEVESRICSGWIHIMSGDYRASSHVVERNYTLIFRPEIGVYSLIQLYMLQLYHLQTLGDDENFQQQKNEYFSRVGHDVLKQSFVYPFLVLWEIELCFSLGSLDTVLALIDSHIHTEKFANPGNYRGELLAWRVLAAAAQGKGDALSTDLDEILEWLAMGASPLHTIKANLLLGHSYHLLGNLRRGLDCLNTAVGLAVSHGMEKMQGCALFHRACLYYEMGKPSESDCDLQGGLVLFKEKLGCNHIFACERDMLLRLLQRGMKMGIQPRFCQTFGRQRLLVDLDSKGAVPLLNVQVLGGLSVSSNRREQTGSAITFIKGQRRLLGLLLKNESHEVSQALVQSTLWPDVPEEKARGRFDTLMARLRKVLAPIVHPHGVKEYLSVSKGVVALRCCLVDSYEFCRLVRRGLVHLENGELWQASNCFYPALKRWNGPVALDLLDLEQGGSFATEPSELLLRMVLEWCPQLAVLQRHDEAVQVCILAWQFNHENKKMATLLYGLYLHLGFTVKARQTLVEFGGALGFLGVSSERQRELCAEIEAVFPPSK